MRQGPAVAGAEGGRGRPDGQGAGAARFLPQGRHWGREGVPGYPEVAGAPLPPKPRGCPIVPQTPRVPPVERRSRGTNGMGTSRVLSQPSSLWRSLVRGGGITVKAQDGAGGQAAAAEAPGIKPVEAPGANVPGSLPAGQSSPTRAKSPGGLSLWKQGSPNMPRGPEPSRGKLTHSSWVGRL